MIHWFIRHAMCALYPPSDGFPGIAGTDLRGFLKRYQRECPFILWLGICAGTFVFVCTPLLTVWLPLPSFLLPAGLLDKHANRVSYSRFYFLRQAVFLVKLGAGLCWGSHPDVRNKLELKAYPAEPSEWRTS